MMDDSSVEIRRLEETDLPLFESLWTDPDVRLFLGGPVAKERCAERLRGMLRDHEALHCSIYSKRFRSSVGIASIHTCHDGCHKEISFQVLPGFHRNGFAYSGVIQMIRQARSLWSLEEIYAETQSRNEASKNLLNKIGMKEIRRLIRYGEEQTVYRMRFEDRPIA